MRIEKLQGFVYPHASAVPLQEADVTYSWLNVRSGDLQEILDTIQEHYPSSKRYLIQFRTDDADDELVPAQGNVLFEPNSGDETAHEYSIDELETVVLDKARDIELLD